MSFFRLHRVFERDDPDGHAALLAALNVAPDDMARIRSHSRA
ncbi:MAG: hypothetical protein VB032_06540 [Burkholderiaceae bacterium]|nr:hypothetical protein [Burkholderiaceae bacterium]